MSTLQSCHAHGQSIWLDFIRRQLIASGELGRLIDQDGIRGVTSNPAIFEKAIGDSSDYDAALAAAVAAGQSDPEQLFEHLAIEDIRAAADVLAGLYRDSDGVDGYVSLEVSPHLAMDLDATVANARRLWRAVDRPNLMIKVPATEPGIAAVRVLIGEGINVNVTLLFARAAYRAVAQAYLEGLETLAAAGGELRSVASVASFFVSRIDTAIDAMIDERLADTSAEQGSQLAALRGRIAVANAKMAYQDFLEIEASPRWQRLAAQGARPQRLLWASTGTKNPAYSDVLYVETLIGRDTVNTVPPATMDAFRDHGSVADTLTEGVAEAREQLEQLAAFGLSLDQVAAQLLGDGVQLFVDAHEKLLGAVARKADTLRAAAVDPAR